MSRSKHARKRKNHKHRPDSSHISGWIIESNKEQRRRMNNEVKKVLRDPEHELIVDLRGKTHAYDWA